MFCLFFESGSAPMKATINSLKYIDQKLSGEHSTCWVVGEGEGGWKVILCQTAPAAAPVKMSRHNFEVNKKTKPNVKTTKP